MFRTIFMPGLSASTRNIVAPPASPGTPLVRAMQMAKAAPSAPLMNHLRPSIRQPPPVLVAVVASARGSDPAPGAGSVIAKQERTSPAASGRRYRSFCPSVATTSSRCILPSSGAAQLSASGPRSEYPAASNTTA